MRSFTVAERRARLARRHFLTTTDATMSLPEMTSALIGWHATDPATPYLSLWARRRGFTRTALDAEIYERRSLVKQLAMRRTLWLISSPDLALVQPAASDRVADTERRRLIADVETAGVAADGGQWLATAETAVLAHLDRHGDATTTELRTALPELAGSYDPAPGKRWGGMTHLAPRVLTVLAVSGAIVRGPNSGSWITSRPRWVRTDAWMGPVHRAPADHARAELVRAWLRTFGPASLADLKWWFGSTLTAKRTALTAVGAVEVDLHGTPGYALPDDLEPVPTPDPWVALLPSLDVTTMGWLERDWYLGGHRSQVFDTNGNAGPTVWCDGRVIGAWAHDADGRVCLQLLEDPGASARKALDRKALELTEWLDGTKISPRFPSPLSKTLAKR
ncbi:winged helix DNA-binding domain-containing protein [Mycolicibacterium mengxianglii]|uniref:winged helix DNA-binding domain-containing protein n=1 Tax=Mycolicibacterium mengxianglii TaxID=2736649 RepID=UPI0018D08968|nr:winged helix DNA-binding domain-containing protein [Mycolicibacterium mengxianglii]